MKYDINISSLFVRVFFFCSRHVIIDLFSDIYEMQGMKHIAGTMLFIYECIKNIIFIIFTLIQNLNIGIYYFYKLHISINMILKL